MKTPMDRLDERYRNDNAFHTVVDTLQSVILQLQLTPGEVRDAAMYASFLVEMRRCPAPVVVARAKIDAALSDPGGRGLRDALLGYADALESAEKGGPYRG